MNPSGRQKERMTTFARSAALGALLTGCGDPAANDVVVADSSDITLVTAPAVERAQTELRLEGPLLSVGGVNSNRDAEFLSHSFWHTAVVLNDGRIVASDGNRLLWFDSAGSALGALGREGTGPGEFKSIQGLCRFQGDSLVVWDEGTARVSIVSPKQTVVRSYAPRGWVAFNTCFANGGVLVKGESRGTVDDVAYAAFKIISTSGDTVRELPRLPVTSYGPVTREVSYVIRGEKIFVGDASFMGVRVYDSAGNLERIIRTRDEPQLTDRKERDEPVPAAGTAGGQRRGSAPKVAAAMYRKMLLDTSGDIWLLTERSRAADVKWVVLSADGSRVATLQLSPKDRAPDRIVGFQGEGPVMLEEQPSGGWQLSFYRVVPSQDVRQ